jgi:predicted pyridoxine 5'-phosphate oxidase superfamily flavin-nucleotide-binding protein
MQSKAISRGRPHVRREPVRWPPFRAPPRPAKCPPPRNRCSRREGRHRFPGGGHGQEGRVAKGADHEGRVPLFQRRCIHAVRQGGAGAQGFAPGLCPDRRTRRLANPHHPDLAAFVEAQTSIFLATATADAQPYIQHRGGPPGFLRVLDEATIGFVDFAGNRQYITQGNLTDNPKAYMFLIDYAQRKRVKIWGEARIVEDDAALTAQLMPEGYKARPEQVILFTVSAWDMNCSQHIPQRFEAADVAAALAKRDGQIEALQEEIRQLRG